MKNLLCKGKSPSPTSVNSEKAPKRPPSEFPKAPKQPKKRGK